ncbi:hybrid sensor histidine kinase/response regulator [Azospirillum sp. ST 5-10]|uniref:hybrid sensor histidine kinase/response regulator n=1 Tax=unclassified Azospirillum TaxID=2630922 RepID=UPI003F49D1E1
MEPTATVPDPTDRPALPGAAGGRVWGVRRHLAVLVLAAAAPLALLSGGLLVHHTLAQRDALERSLGETAHALALALDADLGGIVATLEGAALAGGLAALPSEGAGRFPAVAATLAAAQPTWRSLFLADAFGRTLARDGTPAAAAGATAAVAATVREAIVKDRVAVSGLLPGGAADEPAVAVAVPLRRNGTVGAVIGVTVAAARWSRLLQAQAVPPDWIGVVVDGADRVVARARAPQDYVGRRAPDWYRAATRADAPAHTGGVLEGEALEGQSVVMAFRRSALSGWTLAYAAPREAIAGPLRAGLWTVLAATAAATALAVLLAVRAGRRIAEPLRRLAAAARRGEPLPDGAPSVVREVNDLCAALAGSASDRDGALRERDELLRREAARRREAELANAAKSRFLAAASHDLRQPFQAMRLYHHLLASHVDGRAAEMHDRLGTALASGEALLNALLDVSTLEAGTVQPHRGAFPVQDVIDATLDEVQQQAAGKGLRIGTRPCPAVVDSDPTLLRRILANLLGNAVRYTPAGRVLVACRRRGGALRIEVWDTGIGVPEDRLDSIFEDFVQVANPQRDHRHGLGLGLAVVRRTAALLGHPVTVCSRPGRGSCFAVTVPVSTAPRPLAAPGGRALPAPTRPLSVLLVEDHPDQRAALVRILENAGHRVVAAADGVEALTLAAGLSEAPDVLVSDHRLPGPVDGIAVAAGVGARFGRHLPTVIVTGDTDPALLQDAARRGLRLLHKPIDPVRLQNAVAALADGPPELST